MISSAVLLLASLAAAQSSTMALSVATVPATSDASSMSAASSTSATMTASSSGTATSSGSLSMYTIDPNDPMVSTQMRNQWCNSQRRVCPLLCSNGAFPNTCDPQTLTYECKCNDGTTPDLAQYKQTLPFFECQQYVAECVGKTDVAEDQQKCLAIECGPMGDPQARASQISMSLAAAESTSAPVTSDSSTSSTESATARATSSSSSTHGNAAPTAAARVGSGIVLGGLAAFGLLL